MTQHVKKVAGVGDSKFTTTPLSEAAIMAQTAAKVPARPSLESEFCQPGDCKYLFGIKRGTVYNLEKAGLIKTVSLRQRGSVRGVKLVNIPSVRAYLHGLMESGQPA